MSQAKTGTGLDRLHAAMAARVERDEMPGMVMLVAQGESVDVEAIGVTAFAGNHPMQRDTPFRIASLTKPVIAAATMLLVDDGKLRLNDPVDTWLPELANRRVLRRVDGPLDDTVPAHRAITVDDLLTSRMGFGMLTEPTFDPPSPIVEAGRELGLVLSQPDPRTPHQPDEWMRRFGSLPLMYQPGERWLYNAPFLVLGVLIARVARQPLGDFLHQRLFEPLGMRDTGFWLPAEMTQRLPSYYMTNFQIGQMELQNVSTPDEWSKPPIFPAGTAGLLSTVDDFLAFARLLLNRGTYNGQRLLSERSVELITTNHLTPEQVATSGPILGGRGWGFGMGVSIEPTPEWPVPGRYGWAGGYGTFWVNDPHRCIIGIAMTQTSDFLFNGGLDEFDRLLGAL